MKTRILEALRCEVLRGDKGGSGKYRDISGKPSWYWRASRNTRRH